MKKLTLTVFLSLTFAGHAQASLEGQPAPACPAQVEQTRQSFDPAQYAGKVVLVDFWATWCPPCLKSMPFFNNLYNEYSENGLEIVAINVDEDTQAAQQFLKDHPVDYPMAFDPNGECPKTYNVSAMPSSYLLDKSGTVHKIHLGYRDSDQSILREQIIQLLK